MITLKLDQEKCLTEEDIQVRLEEEETLAIRDIINQTKNV